jgi:hypothetical protein
LKQRAVLAVRMLSIVALIISGMIAFSDRLVCVCGAKKQAN